MTARKTTGTIVLTGANGGLGSAIVSRVVRDASLATALRGVYAVRNAQRAAAVEKALRQLGGSGGAGAGGHDHEVLPLDLASLASVRSFAADVNGRVASGALPPIRALVLCAGWQEYTTQTLTDDGFDMAFQANHLSHFLLALLLLQSMDKTDGRIVIVASWSHDSTDRRNNTGPPMTDFQPFREERFRQIFSAPMDTEPIARSRWSTADEFPGDFCAGYRRYAASKLCEVMFMRELSRRVAADPVLSSVAILGIDPGAMPSTLQSRAPLAFQIGMVLLSIIVHIVRYLQANPDFRTPADSARDVLSAALDTEKVGERPNGVYMNGSVVSEVGPEARDDAKCKKVWENSLVYASVKEGDTMLAEWQ
ncbi:NAD(P)-binding protein [Xylariaceae sp. FL0804]|nr:NAD(P)-binding protein [Xylariaceae sp. FL0804]